MNILLIGSGGREHALAWALKKSPKVKQLWCAPGNAGIGKIATLVPLDPHNIPGLLAFIRENKVDLTVVGPEAPLVAGLADAVYAVDGKAFGPRQAAARLEGSKVFAKNFMKAHGIPTAAYVTFTSYEDAMAYLDSPRWLPSFRVVKASGLAAGKGVIVCQTQEEVKTALKQMLSDRLFGDAGKEVVLEEALEGVELSVMALCDGVVLLPFPPSQDHKRVFDNDLGPNTGGMGAYAPVPQLSEATWKVIKDTVFHPFLLGIKKEKLDYKGVIYFGLMLTAAGPQVLEFNVRFGDPETQAVVPLLSTDWAEALMATVDGRLSDITLRKKKASAVCVVLTAGGYPGPFAKGSEIEGLNGVTDKDVLVFHAGTRNGGRSDAVETAGGRVLGVTAVAPDIETAREKAYSAVRQIHFDGMHFRKDIGVKALKAVTL